MYIKSCCFSGHRQIFHSGVSKRLKQVIGSLVGAGVHTFYSGGMGEFDHLAESVVRDFQRTQQEIQLFLVIAYPTRDLNLQKEYYERAYNGILYPLELVGIHPKSAIQRRNQWMVDHSGYLAAFVTREFGGAFRTLRYAQKKNLDIFNIAEMQGVSK